MKKLFVLLAAVVFVVAFTAPTFAAEWSFYGSARITTFWTDQSDEKGPNNDDDLDLNHSLQGNSRIGAKVKVSDNLIGRFEYGSGPNLRLLYGEYDFGGFKVLVGQDYTPLNFFPSNQVYGGDTDLLPYGGVYNGRRAMVQGKFGGLKIALVQPTAGLLFDEDEISEEIGDDSGEDYGIDTDVTIPMIQASYSFKIAGLSLDIAGGYQTYDMVAWEEATGDETDDDVSSYIVALHAKYNMGPFMLAGNYWMGQNVGNMGMWEEGNAGVNIDWGEEKLLDSDGWGFLLVGAFTLSDMLRFEAGYGYSLFDVDNAEEDDDTSSYYVQATINLAKGVFIVPEIGKIDYGDGSDGEDEGDDTYYGLKWQINF